jgi:hypothetical protein
MVEIYYTYTTALKGRLAEGGMSELADVVRIEFKKQSEFITANPVVKKDIYYQACGLCLSAIYSTAPQGRISGVTKLKYTILYYTYNILHLYSHNILHLYSQ